MSKRDQSAAEGLEVDVEDLRDYLAARDRGIVKLRWWHAGGLHAHVTYPDGSTLHRIWKADHYWEIDSLRLDLEREYESVDVSP